MEPFVKLFFLVSYVEERPWWPIHWPNKERKKKELRGEGNQIKFIDLRFEERIVSIISFEAHFR